MAKRNDSKTPITALLWGVGAILSIASVLLYKELQPFDAVELLEEIKEDFKERGAVYDGWISSQMINYDEETKAYRGGLYCNEEDRVHYYEFLVDAYSGHLLELIDKPKPHSTRA